MTRTGNDYYIQGTIREDEKSRLEEAELALFMTQLETTDLRKRIAQLESALEEERIRSRTFARALHARGPEIIYASNKIDVDISKDKA